MKVLFLGDVVGRAGCEFVSRHLRSLKKLYGVDACVINGENSAEGNGITPDSARMLFDAGADVITTGNHVLKRREIYPVLEEKTASSAQRTTIPACREAECLFWISCAGSSASSTCRARWGWRSVPTPSSGSISCSRRCAPPISWWISTRKMTSEKKAMGYYLDGRVSAVIGTHTHVQTADERILPGGTAYLTDAGMCGGRNSVLGVKKEIILQKFITNMPARFEYDPQDIELNGVLITIDPSSGRAQAIERICLCD